MSRLTALILRTSKTMFPFNRILVALDFSAPSQAAFEHAARIAEAANVELLLLHAIPIEKRGNADARRASAMHEIEHAIPAERLLRLNVKFLITEGVPAHVIPETAKEHNVDLIIVGTHGRTGLAHLTEGSIAETVIRRAHCPVLTVRSETTAESAEGGATFRASRRGELEASPAVDLLERAVALRASDLHLDPVNSDEYMVRMRIDGRIEEYCRIDRALASRHLHQLKLLAEVDITDPFHPSEGRLRTLDKLPDLEGRLTVSPVAGGESIALRLSRRTNALSINDLGMSPDDQLKIKELIGAKGGIVLVTGPTGSGKTSTVYAMLNELVSARRNVVSIEDPVEYSIPYVRQVAVDERHGLTMTAGLKTLLRMDPDVIFVGEIRDAEAAAIAMQAASSGRRVFSTLHTRDVAACITTLRDLGIENNSLGANLAAIVNQRLIRRLCEKCKRERQPTDEERACFTAEGINPPSLIFDAAGCDKCRHHGFYGRTGIFEVAKVTPRIAESIAQGMSEGTIRELLRAEGVSSLRMSALRKVTDGTTTLCEVQEF